ncbi:hypothetical protein O0I10_007636 [Lichtheimia ornata]|uniref:Reverse transcriptase domain-containing protein n=1 Tax=Lichtheimia ornata TaxID=688661 RepID=A0AAD7UZM1_9FUNG|nr:uncharacterized protein O0I10_007636 [Lichtheimia ornata]KAJ8656559.1 hypothetical protein O0I10_007636 [Lichtheimia ornata]
MFPGCSCVVTKHVAIICIRSDLSLTDTMVSMDERVVVASIVDHQQHTLCRVINSYVPAQPIARPDFLSSFMALPFIEDLNSEAGPWVLVGDFNMNLHHHHIIRQDHVKPWYDWIHSHFNNCFPEGLSSFKRGNSRSTIDYIFGHHSLVSRLTNAMSHFLPSQWTDHALMTIDLLPARQDFGPGAWRFNPTLLSNEKFVALLDHATELFLQELQNEATSHHEQSPQHQWESFKHMLKHTAQCFSRGSTTRANRNLSTLQRQRQNLLSAFDPHNNQPADSTISQRLQHIEQQIDNLIQQQTQHALLRSATRWHDKGERNNQYFYRVIKTRQQQQTIQSLKSMDNGTTLTDSRAIIQETRRFYQRLYTPEDIDPTAIDQLLNNIPTDVKLSSSDTEDILSSLSKLDLIDLLDHTPLGKSPGLDGIPFEVYRHLAHRSPPFCSLLLTVIRQAFDGNFPTSWLETRMVLLFKKGDPELLANWRPLSLINSDAKLFTKLIANRINPILSRIINPYQTGFMSHRLISDNGWINQVLMANARATRASNTSVAVFLDQEKAYDRVHPEYLRRVMTHFGFPTSLINSLSMLFFNTKIHVSVNGWLGSPFIQARGLRQGDPLSPLLFNIAFEPFLRSILASPLQGVSLVPTNIRSTYKAQPSSVHFYDQDDNEQLDMISVTAMESPPRIKLLSYADDLEVFLASPDEWAILSALLLQYRQASNAKVNLSKTVMMPLDGTTNDTWISLASTYGAQWHDSANTTALRYLGYPLFHNNSQLGNYLADIKGKIMRHANILKSRHLSIRGAGMVANSLLLSKLWHIMRVVPVPKYWLKEVKTVVRSFLLPFWPAPSWDTMCLPRRFGGVGLVDLKAQSRALHFIYLQRLCQPLQRSDFVSQWIIKYFQLLTGHSSLLPWFLFPKRFHPCMKMDQNMALLGKVLSLLPQLPLSSSWSRRWLLDLPLQAVLLPHAQYPSLPLRYLLSDIVRWDPRRQCLLFLQHRLSPSLTQVVDTLHDTITTNSQHPLHLIDNITIHIPHSLLSSPRYTSQQFQPKSFLPSFNHWTIPVSSRKTSSIPHLTLTQLRRIWHPSWQRILNRPRPPEIPRPISLIFPPSFWRRFWKLPLPHKAITPWWCLLHECVGTRQKFYKWKIKDTTSPECSICKAGNEDLYHMFVDCPMKRPFWIDALAHFHLSHLLPNQQCIWHALISLKSIDHRPLPEPVLCRLGAILAVLWRCHWRCIIENDDWSNLHAMNLLTSDILYSSFVPAEISSPI